LTRTRATSMDTIADLSAKLSAGSVSSAALIDEALARGLDPTGEGGRTFISIDDRGAREAAATFDRLRRSEYRQGPLAGLPISVKDLFDVQGQATSAGSLVLKDAAPAADDAPAIARLRAAGAVFIGRTNMTEFAYSGLGLNPHFGTPANSYDRSSRRIPGGSSSGAAVSVADGMAVAGIGTDTGGSTRIPAALCGLVGFKPTQARIPLDGVVPLSPSLDSVGAIARSVGCCAVIDAVMAGDKAEPVEPVPADGLTLGVPSRFFLDDADETVSATFERALDGLSRAEVRLVAIDLARFDELAAVNAGGSLAALEAFAWHRQFREHWDLYDPRVLERILPGEKATAADYLDLMAARRDLVSWMDREIRDVDAVVCPTVPRVAPFISSLENDNAVYRQVNRLMLRNTSVANFFDLCAISIPCHAPGDAPVGLMLIGQRFRDRELFRAAASVERIVTSAP